MLSSRLTNVHVDAIFENVLQNQPHLLQIMVVSNKK